MLNTKTLKYVFIIVLLLASIGLTWVQLVSDDEDMSEVWLLARDVKRGDVVKATDFHLGRIKASSYPGDCVKNLQEVEGKIARVDLGIHMIATKNLFGEVNHYQPEKGNALTAIRMLPDSAICWTSELGEHLDVYFVEDKQPAEKLGSVIVRGKMDQRMGEDELYTFMVVEGNQKTVLKIVEKRANGRIEIVKQR